MLPSWSLPFFLRPDCWATIAPLSWSFPKSSLILFHLQWTDRTCSDVTRELLQMYQVLLPILEWKLNAFWSDLLCTSIFQSLRYRAHGFFGKSWFLSLISHALRFFVWQFQTYPDTCLPTLYISPAKFCTPLSHSSCWLTISCPVASCWFSCWRQLFPWSSF